jgi:lathosterol oxidase
MDLVLNVADEYLLDKAWAFIVPVNISQSSLALSWHRHLLTLLSHPPTYDPSILSPVSAWPRDYIPRQLISLSVISLIGGYSLYFVFAGLSYWYIFNHDMMNHPRFLENQVKLEIQCSLRALPVMALFTLPWFQAEVRGYSKLYDNVDDFGLAYLIFSIPL